MDEAKEKKQPETEVLFPDMVIDGVRIRPWTFDQFIDLLPIFRELAEYLKKSGIEVKDVNEAVDDPSKMMDLIMALAPLAGKVVAVSVGVTEEEVRGWAADKAIRVLIVIFTQNANRLKNCFGLGLTAMKVLTTTAG